LIIFIGIDDYLDLKWFNILPRLESVYL